jgi:hypothetical protein
MKARLRSSVSLDVPRRQLIPAVGVARLLSVHLEDPAHRLLLDPLARVAFVDARPGGELRGS